jgi:hypothetical protein
MYQVTKELEPIQIPGSNALCWISAHKDLIASYTDDGRWVLIVLKSGHHIYGWYTDGGWVNYCCPDDYPEDHTPEYWAEELVDCEDWIEAIKDIPALYAYHLLAYQKALS